MCFGKVSQAMVWGTADAQEPTGRPGRRMWPWAEQGRDNVGSHRAETVGGEEEMDGGEGGAGDFLHILITQSPEFSNFLWRFKGERIEDNLRGRAGNGVRQGPVMPRGSLKAVLWLRAVGTSHLR